MLAVLRRFERVKARRRAITDAFSIEREFDEIEETCLPSYAHPNLLLALGAWWRLAVAADLAEKFGCEGRILDFGSSTGELHHFLPRQTQYEFVETNERIVPALKQWIPAAQRRFIEELPSGHYDAIFAMDSLEHCDDRLEIVRRLHGSLRDGGILVASGPTEGLIYRLGRRMAGFTAYAHDETVYDVEADIAQHFSLATRTQGPAMLPVFLVSVWRR